MNFGSDAKEMLCGWQNDSRKRGREILSCVKDSQSEKKRIAEALFRIEICIKFILGGVQQAKQTLMKTWSRYTLAYFACRIAPRINMLHDFILSSFFNIELVFAILMVDKPSEPVLMKSR